jgi:hypothetical protein
MVVGTNDEYVTPLIAADQEALLRGERLAHEVCRFEGGHTLDAGVLRDLAGARESEG